MSSRSYVGDKLFFEILQGFELSLVPEAGKKRESHGAAVEVALKGRKMRFESRLIATEGRSDPQIRGCPSWVRLAFDEAIDHIDSTGECRHALQIDVRGRETEGLTSMIPMHHSAFDLIRPAEEPLRLREVTPPQRLADPRRTDPVSSVLEDRDLDDLEPTVPKRSQGINITGATRTEAKALTHHDAAGMDAFDQSLLDEIIRGKARDHAVEVKLSHVLNPHLAEASPSGGQGLNPRRSATIRHHARRMGIEGENGG